MTKELLTTEEQKFLLRLARKTLELYAREQKQLKLLLTELPSEILKQELGCFVTLHKNKQLRGCIGHILPVQPLYLDVLENAIAAAASIGLSMMPNHG